MGRGDLQRFSQCKPIHACYYPSEEVTNALNEFFSLCLQTCALTSRTSSKGVASCRELLAKVCLELRLIYKAILIANESRYSDGTPPTQRQFTGQINESALGLYFFNARWYDPVLGRFAQADSLVPEPGNPQGLNRYAYVLNNPLRYTDPTGRFSEEAIIDYLKDTYEDHWNEVLEAWKNNSDLWASLLMARPGDFLISEDKGLQYLQFEGVAGKDEKHDTLTGIYEVEQPPKWGEIVVRKSTSQAILDLTRDIVGLARLTNGDFTFKYWYADQRSWSNTYFNVPGVFRPRPRQEINSTGKALTVSVLAIATAETLELGALGIEAGPAGIVVVTVPSWRISAVLLMTLWNVANTPG